MVQLVRQGIARIDRARLRERLRKLSAQLAAATGVAVVLLSVWLVRQGLIVPVVPGPAGGRQETSAPSPAEPASTETGAAEPSEAAATSPSSPPGGEGSPGPSGSSGPSGPSSGAAGGSSGSSGAAPAAPGVVVEQEGSSSETEPALTAPGSAEECLASLAAPATGPVLRGHADLYYCAATGAFRFHSGVDIALREGGKVRAALGGMVTRAARNDAEGWVVEVSHGYGVTTVYAHLGSLLVREGELVAKGQPLGSAGAPGLLEKDLGVHLHYELRVDGDEKDPRPYLGF